MILPAVLANNEPDLGKLLDYAKKHFPAIQLDVMDGEFVPSKSVEADFFEKIEYGNLDVEVHLMVNDPQKWLKYFSAKNVSSIIFHVEIPRKHPPAALHDLIQKIKRTFGKAGLAINPDTPIETLQPYLESIDRVLFLCVNPGFYGAEFKPEVLEKIQTFKSGHGRITVGVDGGVKDANFLQILESGADYICIGSAIFNAADPRKSYDDFVEKFTAARKV